MSETGCRFLGPVKSTRRHAELPSFQIHSCEKLGSCLADSTFHERSGGKLPLCEDCRLFEPTGRPSCANLGPVIRQDLSNLCGTRGSQVNVHSCTVHGECSIGRYCKKQTVQTCTLCSDYVEPIQRHYYRSINDVWHDAFAWSRELPTDIIGFCGVPRSGIPIAHALASSRNCHYIELSSLINGESPWKEQIRRRMGKPHNTDGTILVVDDTSWSGGTMRHTIKPKLSHRTDIKIKYGALYYGPNGRSAIDYGFQQFRHVRQTFQHNLMHDTFSIQQSFDLDGVICEDCPSTEIDHNEERYINWMQTAKPLQIPTNTVGQIVTARLEKYRSVTEFWLKKHGVDVGQLIMLNGFDSNLHRNQTQDAGPRHKAEHYSRLYHSTLFVESDDYQAERIAELTGKSVVAWPSNRKWNCD